MSSRYQNIEIIKSKENKNIYSQVYYPEFGNQEDDIYIITSITDRLDLISLDFYGDEKLWWVIVMVNNLEGDSIFPPVGVQLKIPKNIEDILNKFNKENENI